MTRKRLPCGCVVTTNKYGHPKCSRKSCEKAVYADGLCYEHAQQKLQRERSSKIKKRLTGFFVELDS